MISTQKAQRRYFLSALFVALFILGAPFSASATPSCSEIFANRIEIKNDFLEINKFTVNRNLDIYSKHFPFVQSESLGKIVEILPSGAVWVDMGAGEGRALIDGLKANPKISSGVAIAFKRPENSLKETEAPGRYQYLEGDYVENMARDGKLEHLKGRVDLITDVFGPFTYSEKLPLLLQTYIDLLRPNGIAMFNLMTERSFVVESGKTILLSKPRQMNPVINEGQYINDGVIAWLRTIPGIQVIEVAKFIVTQGQYWESSLAIKIKKISDNVTVPSNLLTSSYVPTGPPERVFWTPSDH